MRRREGAPSFSPYQSGTVALAPLPIKGIDSSADFSLDSFLFQILALIAVGLSTPDTEFQLHWMTKISFALLTAGIVET